MHRSSEAFLVRLHTLKHHSSQLLSLAPLFMRRFLRSCPWPSGHVRGLTRVPPPAMPPGSRPPMVTSAAGVRLGQHSCAAHSEEEPEALLLIKVASYEFAPDPLFVVLIEGCGTLCSKVSKVDGRWDGDAAVALEVAMAQVVGELDNLLHLKHGRHCAGVAVWLVAEDVIAWHPSCALQCIVGDKPEVAVAHHIDGCPRRYIGVELDAALTVGVPQEQAGEVALLDNNEEERWRDAQLATDVVDGVNLWLANGLEGRVRNAVAVYDEPVRKHSPTAPECMQLLLQHLLEVHKLLVAGLGLLAQGCVERGALPVHRGHIGRYRTGFRARRGVKDV
mmetsp:Transcript_83003/g.165713  ORF Transcript_83003/g.165713 Transcript_83003/m.165713 type:complete len:334 (+) Transcript_83003:162-1163(+)